LSSSTVKWKILPTLVFRHFVVVVVVVVVAKAAGSFVTATEFWLDVGVEQ